MRAMRASMESMYKTLLALYEIVEAKAISFAREKPDLSGGARVPVRVLHINREER